MNCAPVLCHFERSEHSERSREILLGSVYSVGKRFLHSLRSVEMTKYYAHLRRRDSCMTTISARNTSRYHGNSVMVMFWAISPNSGGMTIEPI